MNKKLGAAIKLRDLQQDFVDNLNAKQIDPIFLSQLEAGVQPAINRFAIYSKNRRAHLLKTLVNTYPVCQKLVGEQYFKRMVSDYIEQCPSYSPSLYDYGFHLAEALTHSPFVVELPYLIDMIRLEWHIHCLLIHADEPLFDWHTLTLISNDRYGDLIFRRPLNSVLMHSPFPIDRIWETNQTDFIGNDCVDLNEGAVHLFIGRVGFELRIDRLTAIQWAILNAIDGKRSLEELLIALDQKVKETVIIESLPVLIKAGYIANFRS